MGRANPRRRSVGAPHQCPLRSVTGYLCQFMLTCGSTFRSLTITTASGHDLTFTDAERLESVQAQLQVLVEVGTALNAHGIVPMFSLAVPFDATKAARRGYPGVLSRGKVFTEAEVATALANVTWMRYVR